MDRWSVEDVTAERVRDAELVLLVTDHASFDYDLIEREASLIFDSRNRFGALGTGKVEHL